MSTEFTRLNNSIITPIMKAMGFRKIGKYDYGATSDKAIYKSQEKEFHVIFSIHPYDYPLHGVRFKELKEGRTIHEKQYLLENGDMRTLMKSLASDLKENHLRT